MSDPSYYQSPLLSIDEHRLTLKQIENRYNTNIDEENPERSIGISSITTIEKNRQEFGENIMPTRKKKPLWIRYLNYMKNLFSMMLILAGVLTLIIFILDTSRWKNLYTGILFILIAFVNAGLEFYQEYKSDQILQGFMSLVPDNCQVRRRGETLSINVQEVVCGDIIILKTGDKVPADSRIIFSTGMMVDNSSITGESEPQEKSNRTAVSENAANAENLIFSGSLIVNGDGYAVVIRVGPKTVLGFIARETVASERTRQSLISIELKYFTRRIVTVAIILGIFFMCAAFIDSRGVIMAFDVAVGIFVAFLPQGLPATITILLTVAAERMANRNILVKELKGVETLGALTFLATDKTGTLTQNKMSVAAGWFGRIVLQRDELENGRFPSMKSFLRVAILCSKVHHQIEGNDDDNGNGNGNGNGDDKNSNIITRTRTRSMESNNSSKSKEKKESEKEKDKDKDKEGDSSNKTMVCDPTEAGIQRFARQFVTDPYSMQKSYPKAFEIPFSSATKWHMVIVQFPHHHQHDDNYGDYGEGNEIDKGNREKEKEKSSFSSLSPSPSSSSSFSFLMTIKGAAERILNFCSFYYLGKDGGQTAPVDEEFKAEFGKAYDYLAKHGYRILGFAEKPLPSSEFPIGFEFKKRDKSSSSHAHSQSYSSSPDDGEYNFPLSGFIFIGFLALLDPPKENVNQTIDKCRATGIKVAMVTGDHQLTAQAIARQVHIITGEATLIDKDFPMDRLQEISTLSIVVHGDVIDHLEERDWMRIFNFDEIVFARTLPRHKLKIVNASQRLGHIVGVCGDGINDSLALKMADLGISMNLTGSDISKDVATMILLDDNFASIINGIEEGRIIYENLKKSIRYTLTHIMPEVLALSLYAVLKIPLPITPLLILMIDAGTEIGPATSFAYEPKEVDLMIFPCRRRPPTIEEMEKAKAKKRSKGKIKKLADKAFYPLIDHDQKSKGENLIDRGLLIWAFGFGGIILACGCFSAYLLVFVMRSVPLNLLWQTGSITYFQSSSPPMTLTNGSTADGSTQVQILEEAQSAYFLSIVIGQFFNIFVTKHRYRYPWGHDLFVNYHTFIGMFIAAAIAAFVVFIPVIQIVFGTYYVTPVALCAPVAAGIILLISEYIRKFIINRGKFHSEKLSNKMKAANNALRYNNHNPA